MIFDCILILFKLPLEKVPTRCFSRNVSELQYHEDGVNATRCHRDAVFMIIRESTRRVREPRQFRDSVVPAQDSISIFNHQASVRGRARHLGGDHRRRGSRRLYLPKS